MKSKGFARFVPWCLGLVLVLLPTGLYGGEQGGSPYPKTPQSEAQKARHRKRLDNLRKRIVKAGKAGQTRELEYLLEHIEFIFATYAKSKYGMDYKTFMETFAFGRPARIDEVTDTLYDLGNLIYDFAPEIFPPLPPPKGPPPPSYSPFIPREPEDPPGYLGEGEEYDDLVIPKTFTITAKRTFVVLTGDDIIRVDTGETVTVTEGDTIAWGSGRKVDVGPDFRIRQFFSGLAPFIPRPPVTVINEGLDIPPTIDTTPPPPGTSEETAPPTEVSLGPGSFTEPDYPRTGQLAPEFPNDPFYHSREAGGSATKAMGR